MKQMLKDTKVNCSEPVVIYYDNSTTIDMSKNPVFHSKPKHIWVKYNFLKDKVEAKEVKLVYVNTKEQIADIFTKPLSKESFEYLWDMLGVSTPLVETWLMQFVISLTCIIRDIIHSSIDEWFYYSREVVSSEIQRFIFLLWYFC